MSLKFYKNYKIGYEILVWNFCKLIKRDYWTVEQGIKTTFYKLAEVWKQHNQFLSYISACISIFVLVAK